MARAGGNDTAYRNCQCLVRDPSSSAQSEWRSRKHEVFMSDPTDRDRQQREMTEELRLLDALINDLRDDDRSRYVVHVPHAEDVASDW